ncbi:MAG: DUF4349 domain-containing protein [Dehalococcoidia bacterium]|nr:DUF4349 domain-containing protein [Dehalococcoidia bacterium]MDD5494801.1 DUF4349 domain-containing protein [Dehalococcoidia bacterium]
MNRLLKSLTLPVITAVLLSSLACSAVSWGGIKQSTPDQRTTMSYPAVMPAPAPAAPMEPMAGSTEYYSKNSAGYDAGSGVVEESADRKIVRTGSIWIEVKDIDVALADISSLAIQLNGYVVSSTQRADEAEPTGWISIRIPVEKFNEALQKLRALGVKVLNENTNSQDVTEQYSDLSAQLRNLEATEAQYLELLKKAENVKDILEVQRELSNVRGNIERIKGRMQYLERTSDMSVIEISLKKTRPIGESTWDVPGIFKSAVDGLIVFGKFLAGLLIWVLVFAPVWIIILVIIFVARRRSKAKKAAN